MVNRLWIPVLASLALLLSACGDSQEEANVAPEEPPATVTDEEGTATSAAAQDDVQNEVPDPEEVEDAIEARQAAEQLEAAEAMREGDASEPGAPEANELQAGEETLGADPEEALDEASAMPGETTRSDVDDVIAETERRFEEAQRQLEEQFQEVEQQRPELEPMESDRLSGDWETDSAITNGARLDDGLEATDVDALIEDTERRFEEAQRRLEEQFEELERERLENSGARNGTTSP
ncbi:MAG: hypothetical protein P3W96_009545 [Halomonas sp.]|nr:hypothetical protein [Halomonas sp.]MDM7482234.1 hypothetical protein [Halomonas sp.]